MRVLRSRVSPEFRRESHSVQNAIGINVRDDWAKVGDNEARGCRAIVSTPRPGNAHSVQQSSPAVWLGQVSSGSARATCIIVLIFLTFQEYICIIFCYCYWCILNLPDPVHTDAHDTPCAFPKMVQADFEY